MAYDAVVLSTVDAQRQVEQLMLPGLGSSDFQWSSGFDPASFFLAMSSRIPNVEEGSLNEEASPLLQDSSPVGPQLDLLSPNIPPRPGHEEKTVKIIWWRPHGHTAIAPGLFLILIPGSLFR